MKRLGYFLLLLVLPQSLCPSSQKGTSGANFLKIQPSAQAAAMASQCLTCGGDAYALYQNPGALAEPHDLSLGATYASHFESIAFNYLGFVYPFKDSQQSLGVSITNLSVKDLEKRTSDTDQPESLFTAGDSAYQVSYSRSLKDSLDLGSSLKYIASRIEAESASAYALDFGLLWKKDKGALKALGVSLRNLGSQMKFKQESDPLPLSVDLGASLNFLDGKLFVLPEIHLPRDNEPGLSAGAEYAFKLTEDFSLALRSGYTSLYNDSNGLAGLAAGLGFKYRRLGFDFAWIPYGDLGNTFRYSLLARF